MTKFRAWHKAKKKYLEVMRLVHTQEGVIAVLLDEGKQDISAFLEEIELEAYIEVKDKNGTEIYRGDIVRIDGHVVVVEYDPEIAQWSISPDLASIRLKEGMNKRVLGGKSKRVWAIDYPRVIGNIHENPELKP